MKFNSTYTFYLLLTFLLLGTNTIAQNTSCPPNLDFEQGNLDNWEFYIGSSVNCCPLSTPTTTGGPVVGRHTLVSGAGLDPYGLFPVVAPGGGNFSLLLGNDATNAQAERARYYVRVPSNPNNIYTLLYSYAVVFQDPSHSPVEQPRFEVNVFDSATGNPLPCNQFNFVADAVLPGFKTSTRPGAIDVRYKEWSTASIDLSPFAGQTVAVDFTTGDCSRGGHFGYAYLDVACNSFQTYSLFCPATPTITLTSPPGFKDYEWWNQTYTTLLGTTQDLTVPTPTGNTVFNVILSPFAGFGCPDTLSTTFSYSTMTVDVTLDTAVCKGESVQLTSGTNSTNGPYIYQWSPGAGLSCTNCADPLATSSINSKYYISVTDKDGCTGLDSVIVRVDENVYSNVVVGDTFCSIENVGIKSTVTNPKGANYLWKVIEDGGNITYGEFTDSINAQWFAEGTKKIKLSVLNGLCIAEDSSYIYINPTPNSAFDVLNNICINVPLKISPLDQDAKYSWEIDGHSINDTTYTGPLLLQWSTPGSRRIYLKISNEYGCESEHEEIVGIHEYPVAKIIPLDVENVCYGKQFSLGAEEGDRYKYSWYPPQFFSSNGNPIVTGTSERTGFIKLDVTNQWRCTSSDSIFISAAACCEIFMPDAFSPNNDGHNDTYWSPDMNKYTLVKFMIANRRGQIVFDSETAREKWDGTYNGQPLGIDTYNYYIKYLCKENEPIEKKGTFMLLR